MDNLKTVDRRNSNSVKWDSITTKYGKENLLPFWIADMDFQCSEEILSEIKKYVERGALGYTFPSDEYFENFINWEKGNHHVDIRREWIRYAPSVVTGVAWVLEQIVKTGDTGLVMTPVYSPLFKTLERCGVEVIAYELENNDGYYTINFDAFEKTIRKYKIKVFLLCSPHNPVGRVWKREEIFQLLSICKKYGVYVISDEVHQDIVMEGNTHTSVLAFPDFLDNITMITSGAKSFNLAGVENSFVVIPQKNIRDRVDILQDRIAVHSGNTIGYIATSAAYRYGRAWLEAVVRQIQENYRFVSQFIKKELPKAVISPLEGTFLMWIDFGAYLQPNENIEQRMIEKWGIVVNPGKDFGGKGFEAFIRFNIATSKELIQKGLAALVQDLGGKG